MEPWQLTASAAAAKLRDGTLTAEALTRSCLERIAEREPVTKAFSYLDGASGQTSAQLKQAVISASAISLMYPGDGLDGYPREAFIEDLVREAASEMRGCLDRGAIVQIDFTEARLSLKLDPSGGLLGAFVDLNNRVLDGLSDEERSRVGVHSCPGGDQDSTHSADVDYAELLPALCRLNVGSFYVEMAGEKDREPALKVLGERQAGDRVGGKARLALLAVGDDR